MSELREVNLEHGIPTVQTALSQLALELRRTRSMGCTGLKIIHGLRIFGQGRQDPVFKPAAAWRG